MGVDWAALYSDQQPNLAGLDASCDLQDILVNIKMLGKNKSPGPNGLTPEFFIAIWEIVKHDLKSALGDLIIRSDDWSRINRSFITLIPKSEGAEDINSFHSLA
ncbi:COP9 signalosome complex subunit 2 [Canna indica]|uniref:COP9 signalosome complex subunit 2 n=1 Tax=Canna indica TaxID=4628 RepID=A0AAQ3K231_9LILI|nr:COP9 signalosome complex subunit 2 [Canna indica]